MNMIEKVARASRPEYDDLSLINKVRALGDAAAAIEAMTSSDHFPDTGNMAAQKLVKVDAPCGYNGCIFTGGLGCAAPGCPKQQTSPQEEPKTCVI